MSSPRLSRSVRLAPVDLPAAAPRRKRPAPRSARTLALLVALVASLSACTAKLNGRSIGFGSSSPPGPRPIATAAAGAAGTSSTAAIVASTPGDDRDASAVPRSPAAVASATAAPASAPSPTSSTCRPQRWADSRPYLDRPADPWLAVANGRPVRVSIPTDLQSPREPTAHCDAAHDHCLRDCSWLLVEPTPYVASAYGKVVHFDADGVFREAEYAYDPIDSGFVAYRTVPVTRKNLRIGMLVLAAPEPRWDNGRLQLSDSITAAIWDFGTVESIDWDAGTLRLEKHATTYFLWATRLAVLRYEEGGKVELIPGVDARAPAVADVIAPPPPPP